MDPFSIQSPLLVFDEVHRGTGTIERECVIENRLAETLDLRVEYHFPEHSWVQLYAPGSGVEAPIGCGPVALRPGENRVLISLNTDSFHFPDTAFRGRISFVDRDHRYDWIEINFESVRQLEPFTGYAAIDIGTSTSTVALYHVMRDAVRREPWTPRLEEETEYIPSAVYIRDALKFVRCADGGCLVGGDAIRAYRHRDLRAPLSLQVGTKRLLGSPRMLIADEHGAGGFVDPLDVLEALARDVRERAQRHPHVRSLLRKVCVTFPPTWSYRQVSRWKEVFRRVGLDENDIDMSVDEASAAGLFHVYNAVRERDARDRLIQDLVETEREVEEDGEKGSAYTLRLLSFDFGGGTIDLALLEAELRIFPRLIRLRLALDGSDSLEYGGDRVTLAIFRMLKRRIAMAIADPARLLEAAIGRRDDREDEPPAPPRPAVCAPALRGRHAPERFLLPDGPSHRGSLEASRGSGALWSGGSNGGDSAGDAALARVRESWDTFAAGIAGDLDESLDDAVDRLFPTRYQRSEGEPIRLDARRNFDWLWRRAEELKLRLVARIEHELGDRRFPGAEDLVGLREGVPLDTAPDERVLRAVPWAAEPASSEVISVSAGELLEAISPAMERALFKARQLTGDGRVDRVVLSGQSGRIPMVRWLLSRPPADGGLGIAPSRIDFDEKNAKQAVSKGACLLHVMREALVGFEVDICDFRARLLSDFFYLQADLGRRVLFAAGEVDDLVPFEDVPEPRGFPKYLSIYCGDEDHLAGQFRFADDGESLPTALPDDSAPSHAELLALRERDRTRASRLTSTILGWSARERIAWMERSADATGASPSRPVYRYYLTRQHDLFAVRDTGSAGKRLFALRADTSPITGLAPGENPFSGVH